MYLKGLDEHVMKKLCLLLATIVLMIFFTSCTDKENENSDVFNEDWYENLGVGLKQILESKANNNPNEDIVVYINGIPGRNNRQEN